VSITNQMRSYSMAGLLLLLDESLDLDITTSKSNLNCSGISLMSGEKIFNTWIIICLLCFKHSDVCVYASHDSDTTVLIITTVFLLHYLSVCTETICSDLIRDNSCAILHHLTSRHFTCC
jgi:hypothetical protein